MDVNILKVNKNIQVSDRYWHMVIDAPTLVNKTTPGQFFHIRCGDDDFPFLRRPFSIYRINKDDGTLEFLYLVKGEGTQKLTEIKEGESIDVLGPAGIGFTIEEEWEKILLVARGVGIATLAAIAQEASERNIQCIAILSARSRNDLLATEQLQNLGAEVYKVTEEEDTSDVENVEYILSDILEKHEIDAGFTCGSKRLSKLLRNVSEDNDIPSQIALEENMGCAMGACYACVCDIIEDGKVHPVRACTEGPVFKLNQVVLEK